MAKYGVFDRLKIYNKYPFGKQDRHIKSVSGQNVTKLIFSEKKLITSKKAGIHRRETRQSVVIMKVSK